MSCLYKLEAAEKSVTLPACRVDERIAKYCCVSENSKKKTSDRRVKTDIKEAHFRQRESKGSENPTEM